MKVLTIVKLRLGIFNRVYKSFVVPLKSYFHNWWIFIFYYTEWYSEIQLREHFLAFIIGGILKKLYFGVSMGLLSYLFRDLLFCFMVTLFILPISLGWKCPLGRSSVS